MAIASMTHTNSCQTTAPTGPVYGGDAQSRMVAALDADQDFFYDLETQFYDMRALSTTLETLLTPVTRDLADIDRGKSAAIDYAVIHLADTIRNLSDRYSEMRWPAPVVAA